MADLKITITIPKSHINRIQETFKGLSGNELTLQDEASSFINFSIETKREKESHLEFGERFIKQAVRQFVRLWELKSDVKRYKNGVSSIPLPKESVPTDIIN